MNKSIPIDSKSVDNNGKRVTHLSQSVSISGGGIIYDGNVIQFPENGDFVFNGNPLKKSQPINIPIVSNTYKSHQSKKPRIFIQECEINGEIYDRNSAIHHYGTVNQKNVTKKETLNKDGKRQETTVVESVTQITDGNNITTRRSITTNITYRNN